MKAANIHEIKLELSATKQPRLVQLCLRLARFKKENKELLTYLLFEAHDDAGYISALSRKPICNLPKSIFHSYILLKRACERFCEGSISTCAIWVQNWLKWNYSSISAPN